MKAGGRTEHVKQELGSSQQQLGISSAGRGTGPTWRRRTEAARLLGSGAGRELVGRRRIAERGSLIMRSAPDLRTSLDASPPPPPKHHDLAPGLSLTLSDEV